MVRLRLQDMALGGAEDETHGPRSMCSTHPSPPAKHPTGTASDNLISPAVTAMADSGRRPKFTRPGAVHMALVGGVA